MILLALVAVAVLPASARAKVAPVTWCGTDETAANRVPDLTVGKPIRFVYAIPSDAPDRFRETASGIATDAASIDAWWRAQDPIRTPRFDRYPFPGCTSDWGQLDIGFVRLPHSSAEYRNGPSTYTMLQADLAKSFPDDQKTLLYYDGPMAEENLCGESPVAQFWGGQYGISIMFLQTAKNCFMTPVGQASSAEVAAHELLHSLGAVLDGAPHLCNGAHVCDSGTDILGSIIGLASTLDVVALDFGRDDYYAHSGSWFDVQDSLWLSHLPQRTLTVSIAGEGSAIVTVGTLTVPCATGCTTTFDGDAKTFVTAEPADGWQVGGWSGSCSGNDDTCILSGSGDANVALTLVRASVTAVVRVTGKGRVTSTPAGFSCTATCKHTFPATSEVTLKAVPAAGYRFAGWKGDCDRTGRCSVGDGGAVTATFTKAKKR